MSGARPETLKRTGGRPRKWGSDAERSKARRAAETLRAALDRDPALAPELLALARAAGLLGRRPETADPLESKNDRDDSPVPEAPSTIAVDAPAAVKLPIMTEATWPDAMNLLQQAYCAFAIVSRRDLSGYERDPCAGALARILWKTLQVGSGVFPELEPLAIAERILSLAHHGRPGSPTRDDEAWRHRDGKRVPVPPDDLDLVDRCLRVAFSFVLDAANLYDHGNTPPIDSAEARKAWRRWKNDMPKRLERAEKAPEKRKRLAFLQAINFSTSVDSYWSHKGRQASIEQYIACFMRSHDVIASRDITPEMARSCVEAWRKKKGQRGKWDVLADACNTLGLGEVTGRALCLEYSTAVRAGEAQPPRKASPEAQDAANRAARELAARQEDSAADV